VRYNPEWDAIGRVSEPVAQATIDEVNEILFAPDPSPITLARVEVCVVLGSRNCGYKAQRAAELFGANQGVVFVACGANVSAMGIPEAELIQGILVDSGISASRVLIDEHSTKTASNLLHAERLIAERVADPRSLNIAIISSGFHRRHVFASLPISLAHVIYVSATGPRTGRDTWHTNAMGRAVILHELKRPGLGLVSEPMSTGAEC
jgi:intracellular sulfur oxidation DsrE/DsrF family protein